MAFITTSPDQLFLSPRILVIYGPTGVGKTDFALQLAAHIPAEIINIDVGQFYEPLTIGTAKPDWRSLSVPHHGFDIITKPENFTVVAYRALCKKLIEDIWQRGKLPILVGGSGFYLKSLFFPPSINNNDSDIDKSPAMIAMADLLAPKESSFDADAIEGYWWQQLYLIDPIRAHHLDPHDTYRIKRALTIWAQTGMLPSSYAPVFNPIASAEILFLSRDTTELYAIINKRVEQMIEHGWLQEVESLRGTEWESFIRQKKLIGYNELLHYLSAKNKENENENDFMKTCALIKQKTRHYAKRQKSFWRMFESLCAPFVSDNAAYNGQDYSLSLRTINLTLFPSSLYINLLTDAYSLLLKRKR